MTRSGEPLLRFKTPDYKTLGLRGNPFPLAGLARPHDTYPLIDQTLDSEVHDFISATLNSREFGGLAILGEYGAGKTYCLRYIQTLLSTIVTRPELEELSDVIAIYVERPVPTIMGLVGDVCERIGRPRVQRILLEIVFADLASAVKSSGDADKPRLAAINERFAAAQKGSLFGREDLLSQLADPSAAMNPRSAVDALRSGGISTDGLVEFGSDSLCQLFGPMNGRASDVARHLSEFAFASPAKEVRLWRAFLSGRLMARGEPVAELSGNDVWSCVRRILFSAGYHMVYWLVDEFEELEGQDMRSATLLRSFLADFRNLIDANLEGFSLVLASKPPFWDVCQRLHTGFVQRFARLIALPPNSLDDLREMIAKRLGIARLPSSGRTELQPFADAAVREIHKLSAGNTRVAVEACHVLLWHAATSHLPQIDQDSVRNISAIRRAFYYLTRSPDRGQS